MFLTKREKDRKMYIEIVLMGSGFSLESPREWVQPNKKQRNPHYLILCRWGDLGWGSACQWPYPYVQGKKREKKKKVISPRRDWTVPWNLDLIPFSLLLYKPVIESISGSSLGFTAPYLSLYPFSLASCFLLLATCWTSFCFSFSYLFDREQPWQCMVIMSWACHNDLTSEIGIQRSYPQGHTGANSKRLASTMPS